VAEGVIDKRLRRLAVEVAEGLDPRRDGVPVEVEEVLEEDERGEASSAFIVHLYGSSYGPSVAVSLAEDELGLDVDAVREGDVLNWIADEFEDMVYSILAGEPALRPEAGCEDWWLSWDDNRLLLTATYVQEE